MLQVVPALLFMGTICYILGYGILTFLTERKLLSDHPYHIRFHLSYLLAGTVGAGIYAQLFSLVGRVGLVADLVLIAICAVIVWARRRQIRDRILPGGKFPPCSEWVPAVLLFLAIAYGTSHGIMHYDTGLYHAQSIRFVEEYGTVRGLANLHSRLGYNSAVFPLTALFSFSWLGQDLSLHVTSGYFALLLAFACLGLGHILRREKPILTDFVRFAGLYYLFNIFKEMVSPASDYALNCFLFCLLILWVDLDVRNESHEMPYALLACGIVYAVTIKLSAVMLLVLALKPIVRIVKSKRSPGRAVGVIGLYLLLGTAIAVPWFLRNAMISGWLLYPSTAIGVSGAEWQVPHDLAEGDAAGIRAYAKGTDGSLFAGGEPGFAEWFPVWLAAQSRVSGILLLLDLAIAAAYPVYLVVSGWRKRRFLFPEGVLLLSFLFWFTQSPLLRYGFFFVWAPAVLVAGRVLPVLLHRLGDRHAAAITSILAGCLLVFLLYKGVRLVMMDISLTRPQYLLTQQEYEAFEVAPYEVDGETFYMPVSGDRTGYTGFPGGPYRADIRLLGESLREGLRYGN